MAFEYIYIKLKEKKMVKEKNKINKRRRKVKRKRTKINGREDKKRRKNEKNLIRYSLQKEILHFTFFRNKAVTINIRTYT